MDKERPTCDGVWVCPASLLPASSALTFETSLAARASSTTFTLPPYANSASISASVIGETAEAPGSMASSFALSAALMRPAASPVAGE